MDIYSGKENPLSVSRKYSTVYACQFDLTLYPFDSQHCDIHLQIVSGQVSFLDVHPNSSVKYLGSDVLNEYQVMFYITKPAGGKQHPYILVNIPEEVPYQSNNILKL